MTLLKFRRGTSADWSSVNPILAAGEPGFETDTEKFKIGDGSTHWNALAYQMGGSDSSSAISDAISRLNLGTAATHNVEDFASPTMLSGLYLPDRFNDTTETVPAGSTTNCAVAGVTKTAPTPDATLANPPKRFSIRSATTDGDITVSYPDSAGNVVSVLLGRRSAITFRQKTNLGYGVESGNRSDQDLSNLYASATAFATTQAAVETLKTAVQNVGTGGSSAVLSQELYNGPLGANVPVTPVVLFDTQPTPPGVQLSKVAVTSTSDQSHTVKLQSSSDGTTWTDLTTLTATGSGGVSQVVSLTDRYVRFIITNGATPSANTHTRVVFS